jgi:hypothetical protein
MVEQCAATANVRYRDGSCCKSPFLAAGGRSDFFHDYGLNPVLLEGELLQ